MINKFSEETKKHLKNYVYKLIDPRDGKVFYIGKGKGNRVFSHMNLSDDYKAEDEETEKTARIRAIQNEGLNVIAIIHRHGMEEQTAFSVEAALIDEYENLTNIQLGQGSSDYGPLNVNQVEQIYKLDQLDDNEINPKDCLLLIKIKESSILDNNNDIYKTVHYAWKIGKDREKVKKVAAVVNGVIKKVYEVDNWYYVKERDRYAFNGHEIKSKYVNKRIPNKYMKKGMASPFYYTFDRKKSE